MVRIEHLFLVTEFGTQYSESAIIQIHSSFQRYYEENRFLKLLRFTKNILKIFTSVI